MDTPISFPKDTLDGHSNLFRKVMKDHRVKESVRVKYVQVNTQGNRMVGFRKTTASMNQYMVGFLQINPTGQVKKTTGSTSQYG